jgi:Holliday junction resolvasome RuvABC ATP-dependent DNA helicase subunit
MKNWYFFDGTGTSGRGFIDWIYEHQNAAGIVIDEIDNLKRNEQAMLYNFLESGQIDYQTSKVRYHFRMEKCKVIATTNSLDRLSKPLKSRFAILHIPTYTFEEFVEIAVRLLGENYNLLADVSIAIANIVWNTLNCKEVRMLDHIGARIKQDDRADDIERLVNLMIKYGQINSSNTEYN